MASQRITWTTTGASASLNKLKLAVQQLQAGRDVLFELKLVLDKYGGDFASMGADLGVSTTDAQTVYNLVTQSYGELCATATTQVSVGAASGSRQLLDALG